METFRFQAEGVVFEFAEGYGIPTVEEWEAARNNLDNPDPYVPPQPPPEHTSRVEAELFAQARLRGVIHGNVATLSELYIAVATLEAWSGTHEIFINTNTT